MIAETVCVILFLSIFFRSRRQLENSPHHSNNGLVVTVTLHRRELLPVSVPCVVGMAVWYCMVVLLALLMGGIIGLAISSAPLVVATVFICRAGVCRGMGAPGKNKVRAVSECEE